MNRSIRTWRTKGRSRRTVAAAATLSLALMAAACGGPGGSDDDGDGGNGGGGAEGDSTGVTDDTIKLGTTQPLTGPAAPGYAKISKAMEAYFKHVNAEGGIHGRQIELIVEDDGYDPTKTADKTRKLVLEEEVFALVGALGTPTHTAVLDFIGQNQVPDLFVASGSLSWNQPETNPYTFGWQTDYTREGKILATYAKDTYGDDKKYCAFGQGDDLGADGAAGLETILGDLAANESYTPTNTNVAPQIGQLQAANCDVVFSFSIPGFTALALGTAAQLDFHPQWVVSSVGADPVALQGYLEDSAAALTQGVVAANYLPSPDDTDNSWIKVFSDINDEYGDDITFDFTALYGYSLAYSVAQALTAAGEDLTREGLVGALESGALEGGPAVTPYAYSVEDHSGMTGLYVTEIDNLKVKELTPPYVTDNGDGPVEEYTGELAEAPENGIPE